MKIHDRRNRYGAMAILLHWIMAILIIGLLAEGLYMIRLPVSLQKLQLFGWHKEYGMLVLILVCFRMGWRLSHRVPDLPFTLPEWQKVAARSAHWAFYFFMFVMPVTGWLITSAAGLPVSFFGWFTFPNLISANANLQSLFSEIHEWLGYALIALVCLHTSAALQHHFINKDNVLKGMLPW